MPYIIAASLMLGFTGIRGPYRVPADRLAFPEMHLKQFNTEMAAMRQQQFDNEQQAVDIPMQTGDSEKDPLFPQPAQSPSW